ncbi:MAG: PLP-dependent aminotransferase family protein [Myxococcales bacterium]|nr:PLP-dependent aminotransferase family protein [Myxococcales bacterium]MBK7191142.1 PLP-dependent aminotransferase family protein [Myxococcales bacterium]MBP6845253.1 PLP-dependent aminotransferase family protein [Kofleriaceae bacterium]
MVHRPRPPRVAPTGPRFLAIARAITDDIRRGVLVPGARLPSSRALARDLDVHRNTVLAALAELEAQGWIATQPARGTFVSDALPAQVGRAAPPHRARAGFALPPAPIAPRGVATHGRGVIALDAGVPDPRGFPVDALARAWRRVVRRSGRTLLGYGPPEGHPALRAALAALVRTLRAVPATAEHVLVTRGSQMALDLCARALLRPGDRVAVEALGYQPSWHALTLAGAELVPIGVDGEGLDVAALARAHARAPIRALYTTPHHQYPTTVTMSAARRLALMALARRHRWVIIEDDYDHEFHYDGRPVTPLAADDPDGHVVYVGTLSKVLAPGLRLGFVVAPPPVIAQLATWRAAMDRQGDQPMEAAVAEFIDDGELERHMRRMRVLYQARRDALVAALAAKLDGVVAAPCPRGGISLWAAVAPGVDVAAWAAAAAAQRVLIAPGARYTFDGHEPGALRLVFAPNTPAELERAVAVMAATAPRPTSRSPSATGSRRRGGPSGSSPPRR